MSVKNLKEQNNKKKVIVSILKILLLAIIIIGIPIYVYIFHGDTIAEFKSFQDVVDMLEGYKTEAILIYVLLQILQIVVSILPGQVFQLAAGYLFGFPLAFLLSIIGATLGTTLTYYISKLLGHDFVHMFFGEEKTAEYVSRLNSKKAYTVIFLLYFIPGLPKDIVSYAAGISEMKYKPLIILSTVGRLPGMMGSIMIGSMWHKQEYFGMIVLGVLATATFICCIIFRKHINEFIDKIYNKLT